MPPRERGAEVHPLHMVRAREDEIVRALGGGAFDHMAKPVSIPILLQRVQRALNV